MDSSSVSSGFSSSSGARRRTTPRLGTLDSPPYANVSLSPRDAQQEIPYVRSPSHLFSFYGTERPLPAVPDDRSTTPRIPDTPAIRIVPPRDGPWDESPPATLVMERGSSSSSSSVYSTDTSHRTSSSGWTTSVSRGSAKKSSDASSLSSATATLIGRIIGRSKPYEPSRRSTIRSAWSAWTSSPRFVWDSQSPTFPISPTPAQVAKNEYRPRWSAFKRMLLASIASVRASGGFGSDARSYCSTASSASASP